MRDGTFWLTRVKLIMGMPVGTFVFVPEPAYHWYVCLYLACITCGALLNDWYRYLSSTAVFLYLSWSLHNVIAWMKNRPFLNRKASLIYIGTVIAVQPYWVVEMTANVSSTYLTLVIVRNIDIKLTKSQFLYFGNKSLLFTHTRPFEALFRDPWWLFTVMNLFWNIKTK